MTKEPRLMAHPVLRISCAASQETVGYLYEWNNGDRQPAWIGKPVRQVDYEPMAQPRSETARSAPTAPRSETGNDREPPAPVVQS